MPSETTHFEHFLIQRPDQQDTIIYKCHLKLLQMTIRKMIHVTIFCSATSTVCFRQPLVMLKREQRCVLVQSYSGSQQQSHACYVISTFGRRSRGEFSWSIGAVGKTLLLYSQCDPGWKCRRVIFTFRRYNVSARIEWNCYSVLSSFANKVQIV